ncbi:MAG: sporulation membrane protein YtaF [Clostridia bacterium]|nr:sporulation membrane protein YtaF [Clostridia bacterium]MDD4146356.1 sporulation membrane protein YtaF [Clostridia bacterium]MDD4665202.1 sporulation membrane protein YtaF [Clostridia bacterium]
MYVVFLFALALSMDGFGMGLSYGLRRIKISFPPLFIICLFSALIIVFSMTLGKALALFLPDRAAAFLGALILIVVGMWIILQNYFLNLVDCHVYCLKIPYWGIMINILKEPVRADLNKSGEIDLKEAFFLGFALSMDALGAGFGAAMSGYSLVLTAVMVAIAEFMMINLGILIGKRLQIKRLKKAATLLPGGIIIFLGLTKLWGL